MTDPKPDEAVEVAPLADLADGWLADIEGQGWQDVQIYCGVDSEVRVRMAGNGVVTETSFQRRGAFVIATKNGRTELCSANLAEADHTFAELFGFARHIGNPARQPGQPNSVAGQARQSAAEQVGEASRGSAPASMQTLLDVRRRAFAVRDSQGVRASGVDGGARWRAEIRDGFGNVAGAGRAYSRQPAQRALRAEAVTAAHRQSIEWTSFIAAGLRTTPVVFGPAAAASFLHELIGHAREADNVARAAGYLAGPADELVTSSELSMWDDPTLANSFGGYRFDDEGIPAERTQLLAAGRVAGALECTRTARKRNVAPNGHGRRSDYRHPAVPRASTVVLDRGTATAEQLLSGPEMLQIRDIVSGDVHPVTGAFRLTAGEAYWVVGGTVRAVRDATIFGQARQALRQVEAVAADYGVDNVLCAKAGQLIGIGLASPSVRFGELQWMS